MLVKKGSYCFSCSQIVSFVCSVLSPSQLQCFILCLTNKVATMF